ncbi:ferric uptake regulator, Fur family [Geotalea uraniireducens Rf4]|uniref:Ferric uptake regulation protein n=1 Tax=Geotalea uraniireducens (strain Rf4) TaxID=351605 RepID=A5G5V6_GEOUR|nr:ferric uptake regulator, Fur family [Geotalea uraniireducens Rf4]
MKITFNCGVIVKRAKKKAFSDFIAQKGLKSTRQRDIILDFFLSSAQHMSLEELYLKLRAKHPGIGYATVYRTLKLFAESGIAREIQFGDGQTRYEQVSEGEHHDHLVCTRCGAIAEFENETIEKLQDEVAAAYGFLIETHKLELYGLCAKCRK